jgi:multiple sugar transport system substrate-binding protein
VWIQEDLPDRVRATQAIVDGFEQQSGVKVELVPVAEDQFAQLLTSSAAAGDLPDVIGGISLPQVRTMSANELIDTEAVAGVMEGLGEDTFSPEAIELTSDGDTRLAVPSESWAQLLVYRKDLFEEAGLEAPTSYDAITAAAKELDGSDVAGFVGATAPADAFTAQTFEHVALGNGCELVDDTGEVTFDSPECVEALTFYQDLVENYSVPGAQDVDTVRNAYFAGEAAMMVWSTFVLDEMAGLRKDAMPSCPECEDDPAFLAKNSGVVGALTGPSNDEPASYGEITSWTVTAGSASEPAAEFVDYMMNDGYLDWIGIAPEGKVPVRSGTAEEPEAYSEAWAGLEAGVDTKAPLDKFYSPDVLELLATGPEEFSRWAIPQGQGELLGAIAGEQPVANAVNEIAGGADPAEVAARIDEEITASAESVQ